MKSRVALRVFDVPPVPGDEADITPAQYAALAGSQEPVPDTRPKLNLLTEIPPLHRAYWDAIQAKIPSLASETNEEQQQGAMDIEESGAFFSGINADVEGDHQTDSSADAGKPGIRSIYDMFNETRQSIDTSGSPICVVSQDQRRLMAFIPPNRLGTKMATTWLVAIEPLVLNVGRSRYIADATGYASAYMILPTIVHESPLALILTRATIPADGVPRFTDAITSFDNLFVLQSIVRELDSKFGEHKSVCNNYYKLLNGRARDLFYTRIDELYLKMMGKKRDEITQYVTEFARAAEEFALMLIHALEWYILDMFRVPFVARAGLMTPRMLHLDAGHTLSSVGFDVMRTVLCASMRNRHLILSSDLPSLKDKTKILKAARPLENDLPCKIEDRLHVLNAYVPGKIPEEVAACTLFGIYNGWIDYHTLYNFMVFLSPDTPEQIRRPDRKGTKITSDEADLLREASSFATASNAGPEAEAEAEAGPMDMSE